MPSLVCANAAGDVDLLTILESDAAVGMYTLASECTRWFAMYQREGSQRTVPLR